MPVHVGEIAWLSAGAASARIARVAVPLVAVSATLTEGLAKFAVPSEMLNGMGMPRRDRIATTAPLNDWLFGLTLGSYENPL